MPRAEADPPRLTTAAPSTACDGAGISQTLVPHAMHAAMHTRHVLYLLCGLCIAAAMPPWGWWPLAFVGLGGWYLLVESPSRWTRARRSSLVALGWFAPSTLWMFDLTAPGWFVVLALNAAAYGAVGLRLSPDRGRRRLELPALVAVVELLRWNVPFGGVPIATLAMAGVSGPLAISARLFGSLLLSTLTVVAGIAFADAVTSRRRAAIAGAVVVAACVTAAALAPRATVVGTLEVAVVQGGGPQNTRADVCQNRAVFERHIEASRQVSAPVDLVVWPEDVVHPSPDGAPTPLACSEPLLGNSEAMEQLTELADRVDAVVVAGFFTRSEANPHRRAAQTGSQATSQTTSQAALTNDNYSLAIGPDGDTIDRYDKVRLVPFGEYVPLRSLIEQLNSEIPGRDVRAGTGPAVLNTPIGPLGISISWEIFFDSRARDAVTNGGEVLLNPTNGSSYWLTILQTQQVASSRLRAIETDRWVLQAAPTGFSAVVDPAGNVVDRTGVSEQRVLTATVEQRRGQTLAVRWGNLPVLLGALAALLVAVTRPDPARQPAPSPALRPRPTR